MTHWRVEVFAALPSTSAYLIARAEAGAPAGLAVRAGEQSAGRGSRGRQWQSAPGNLALSALVRPEWPVAQSGFLPLLAGVAVAQALAARDVTGICLKWPNDILLGGAKLGGILIDAAPVAGQLSWVVIGIGLNLATAPDIAGRPVTALPAHGVSISPAEITDIILARLDHWLAAPPAAITDAWLGYAHPLGTALSVNGAGICEHGRFAGLSDGGALLLDTPEGCKRYNTGEIMLSPA